jgi:N-acetylmuramic acid 6-phosphate etherase
MVSKLIQAEEFSSLVTEQPNPSTREIDLLPTSLILRIINAEDKLVPIAVEQELPFIERAVDLIVASLRAGGHLVYVGAGSSGRLGILDAAECPPTFGTEPEMVRAVISGGRAAVFESQEGAEDDQSKAVIDIDAERLTSIDVVCGIAASRRTPYVVAAINRAREIGAKTIYITTNARSSFDLDVDVAICPEIGSEVIMGSTRMKSGTAQKLILNMLTTTAMIKLGKVYENMMVDLQLKNQKLVERAKRIVSLATGVDGNVAAETLQKAGGHVKTAIVMIVAKVSPQEARRRLEDANGFIRIAIG